MEEGESAIKGNDASVRREKGMRKPVQPPRYLKKKLGISSFSFPPWHFLTKMEIKVGTGGYLTLVRTEAADGGVSIRAL
jgi:hypothetical protein